MNWKNILIFVFLFFSIFTWGTEYYIETLGDCDIVLEDEMNKISLWRFSNNPSGLFWDSEHEYTYNRFLSDSFNLEGEESQFLTYSGTLGYFYPFGRKAAFITEIGISNSKFLLTEDEEEDLGKGNLFILGYNIILQKFLSLGVSGKYAVVNSIDFQEDLQTTSTFLEWNIGLGIKLGNNIKMGFTIFPSYENFENQYISNEFKYDSNAENFGSSINLIAEQGEALRIGINLLTLSNVYNPDFETDFTTIDLETPVFKKLDNREFEFILRHEIQEGKLIYGFRSILSKISKEELNKREEYIILDDEINVEAGFGVSYSPFKYILLCSEYYTLESELEDKLLNKSVKYSGNRSKFGIEFRIFKEYYIRGGYVSSNFLDEYKEAKQSFGLGYKQDSKTTVDLFYSVNEVEYADENLKNEINTLFGFSSRINF
ncbi:MAG: hypothetical protein PHV06_10090 [bacterium]|nr:hypothetical protein [bacterium]